MEQPPATPAPVPGAGADPPPGSAGSSPRSVAWWWGRILAGLSCALLLGHLHRAVAASAIEDPDTPWHLTTGRIIHESGVVPRADTICFTTDGLDLVTVDWLFDLSAYRLYLTLGWAGPLALACLAFGLAALGVCWQLRSRAVGPLAGLAGLALGLFALEVGYAPRPRVWTYAFLAATAGLLARPDPELRLGAGRAGALAGLLALWPHVHSGFVYGWALVLCDAAGAVLDRRRAGGRPVPARSLWLGGACAASCLTFLLHPHGWAVPARIVSWAGGSEVFARTNEMMPLDWREPLAWVVAAVAAAILAAALVARRAPPWREALPLLPFAVEALRHRRVVIPLLLVALGPAAALWTRAGAGRWLSSRLGPLLLPTWRVMPWALGLGLATWLAVGVPRRSAPGIPGQLSAAIDPRALPVEAAVFLARSGRSGRVFSPFELGGLLGWVLYPARAVFIDGRTGFLAHSQVYTSYRQVMDGQPGWQETLARWEVVQAVAPRESALAPRLMQAGWTRVHEDATFVVLERPAPR